MKKILITGATGFVGQNLVRQFAENKEYDIVCVVRSFEKAREVLPNGVRTILSSELPNIASLGVEYVIHLASCLTSRDDTEAMHNILDVNINFSTELLDARKQSIFTVLRVN